MTAWKSVYEGASAEITEKKSRFIATVRPVKTEEEAASFIAEMKKKYWDASHNCSAFIIGNREQITRCSDDGEPAQTAGRPMLETLLGEGLCDTAVVVTRYFGGTLLGTGGLVRAYTRAVGEGLSRCRMIENRFGWKIECRIDYAGVGKVQRLAADESLSILDSVYTDSVRMTLLIPEERLEEFYRKINDTLNGSAVLSEPLRVRYGILDGRTVLPAEE